MKRRPSRDLFPTDEPLARERMIGREEDIDELTRQLSAGVHRIVAGPRRTGKTSVCEAAMGELRGQGLYTTEVSLFRLTNATVLARGLARAALANRGPLARLIRRVRELGETALQGASLTLAVKAQDELGDAVEIALRPGLPVEDPQRAVVASLELIQRLAERDGRRMVLMIDELQELASSRTPYGDPEALTMQIREVLHASPLVSCLFAGSVEHIMRDLFTNRRRALYGFGGFHELSVISAAEWTQGLTARFAEDDCQLEPDAAARMVELGEAHPRATMLVAQQAHVAAVEEGVHEIGLALAQRGFLGAMLADRARHADQVERVRSLGAIATRVVARLARGDSPYRDLEQKAVRRALGALANAGAVSRGRRRGEWTLSDPLLARYIRDEIAT
jgi:hypothetical protein